MRGQGFVGIIPWCVDLEGEFFRDRFYYVCGPKCQKIYWNESNGVSQILVCTVKMARVCFLVFGTNVVGILISLYVCILLFHKN